MQPYRKQFAADQEFPFSLNYRDTKTLKTELPDHVHDWYELVYVHRGTGVFFIDRTFYPMCEGDLFLLPSSTIHRAFPDAIDPVTSTAVFFSGAFVGSAVAGDRYQALGCFGHARSSGAHQLVLTGPERAQIEEKLAAIQQELSGQEAGFRHAVKLLLLQLLLQVNRLLPSQPEDRDPGLRIGPAWMHMALRHIDECKGIRISPAALAERANVTPAHFSRVFKEHTGMTVSDYITMKRILHAKERLRASDDKMEQIAELCGFDSLPHFYHMFKKIAGTTPLAYRRLERAAP